jgi:hypothetical protein
MDHGFDFAATWNMTRYVWYGLAFFLVFLTHLSVISVLPAPLRFFPLSLVAGVIVLHERSLFIGATWIALSGIVYELWGLGAGDLVASCVAAVVAVLLATLVFAKRSFWALLGIGLGTVTSFVVARWLWLAVWAIFSLQTFHLQSVLTDGLTTLWTAVIGTFVFGAYVRRFATWFRVRFVRREPDYEVA